MTDRINVTLKVVKSSKALHMQVDYYAMSVRCIKYLAAQEIDIFVLSLTANEAQDVDLRLGRIYRNTFAAYIEDRQARVP